MARGSGSRCPPGAAVLRNTLPAQRPCLGVRRPSLLRSYPYRAVFSYGSSLGEISNREVLIAYYKADLTLVTFAAQLPAKATEGGEVAAILDISWRCATTGSSFIS